MESVRGPQDMYKIRVHQKTAKTRASDMLDFIQIVKLDIPGDINTCYVYWHYMLQELLRLYPYFVACVEALFLPEGMQEV